MRSLKCLKCRKEMSHSEAKYGLHPQCFSIWFNANSHDEFEGLARKDSLSSADPSIQNSERWNSSFFHGKFLKYAADLAGISYIIKLQDESAPELPYVEYLSNQIAESLGIKIAPFYCINFHEKPAFVTRNLIDKNSNLKSLVHIYHYIPSPKDYNCESLIKIIYEQTNTLREIDSFIQICLFDSLVGNHDRHGRNLGLIVDSNEKYLCPAYDNPSALGLENGDILRAQFSPRGKAWKAFLTPNSIFLQVQKSRVYIII